MIKERVLKFREELGLSGDFSYIEKEDLSPESNAFFNIIAAINSYFSLPAVLDLKQEAVLKTGREAFEFLALHFGGTTPPVVQNDFVINNIKVRLYEREEASKAPLILYAHGGGWARGSLDTHNTLCAHLCHKTGFNVLAVDYRLSPEHPYPAALNEMETVYQWAVQNYQEILFGGDSAGGNLVTSLTLKLRHNNLKQPKALLLIYPSFDLRPIVNSSNPYAEGYFLSCERMNQLFSVYLQDHVKYAATDPFISPFLEKDLRQFPYSIIVSAECDPLCKEAEEFADKLKTAGNKVEHLIVPKVLHAFAQFFDLYPEAEEALGFITKKLERIHIDLIS